MKSIQRVFNKTKKENPLLSDYICFTETIMGKKFSKQIITRHFNKLVDKDDYDKKDKKSLLEQLFKLSQGDEKSG